MEAEGIEPSSRRFGINGKTKTTRILPLDQHQVLKQTFDLQKLFRTAELSRLPNKDDTIFSLPDDVLTGLRQDAHHVDLCDKKGYREDGSRISWHGFRHSLITALAMETTPAVVAAMVGHASATTTLRFYTHITAEAAASSVSTLISQGLHDQQKCSEDDVSLDKERGRLN